MTKEYLVESTKALEIVERKVREFENGPDLTGRIEILEKLLPKTQGFEDFQATKAEIDKLAYEEMKGVPERPIPLDVKERIEANFDIEMTVVAADMEKKYAEIEALLAKFEKDTTPLLTDLINMHAKVDKASRLGLLVDLIYRKGLDGRSQRSSYELPLKTGLKKHYAYKLNVDVKKIMSKYGGAK